MTEPEGALEDREEGRRQIDERSIRAVRMGHGANCSSIGSVIDTLFATAVIGAAVFAAITAAVKTEKIKIVGRQQRDDGADARQRKDG